VQPILSFSRNDLFEIQIPICCKDTVINSEHTFWEGLKIEDSLGGSFLTYEKTLRRTNLKFDRLRYCEFENAIHIWKGEQSLSIKKSLVDFRKIFSKNFKVSSITYDIFKLYIFKVRMTASEKGIPH
jgi:hypothetical protein